MSEINLNIKVKGGKRTPPQVTVYGTAINQKTIEFSNGEKVTEADLVRWLVENLQKALNRVAGIGG